MKQLKMSAFARVILSILHGDFCPEGAYAPKGCENALVESTPPETIELREYVATYPSVYKVNISYRGGRYSTVGIRAYDLQKTLRVRSLIAAAAYQPIPPLPDYHAKFVFDSGDNDEVDDALGNDSTNG